MDPFLCRFPGATPVYLLEVVISVLVSVFALLATSYILPYAHSGGFRESPANDPLFSSAFKNDAALCLSFLTAGT
jgi:hypothetical protein